MKANLGSRSSRCEDLLISPSQSLRILVLHYERGGVIIDENEWEEVEPPPTTCHRQSLDTLEKGGLGSTIPPCKVFDFLSLAMD